MFGYVTEIIEDKVKEILDDLLPDFHEEWEFDVSLPKINASNVYAVYDEETNNRLGFVAFTLRFDTRKDDWKIKINGQNSKFLARKENAKEKILDLVQRELDEFAGVWAYN